MRTKPVKFKIWSTCRGGGYMYCRTEPPHPKRNSKGLYPLHRVLMENKVGRILGKDEVVHHKDENKQNNDLSNLEILSRKEHSKHHKPNIESIKFICSGCGSECAERPNFFRKRIKNNRDGKIFCSISCSLKRPIRHGESSTGYRRGCRCDPCKKANATAQRERKRRKKLAVVAR